ncbi:hypothetical protein SKAU_G00429000 [Synaphobranchus kaupii]|uniref:Uncharacterized protein n=1 Tax=Synaphobranchus kaupii TaxID=118154 RepID=A0A9Q1I9C5_SYNKA|nr:hypothetical protein SKAU_G00429000 [Synaphobranchus kaupii]
MDNVSWSEGTQNHAFGMQSTNSAVRDNSRLRHSIPGGWINGNPNVYGSQTQSSPLSNSHTVHHTPHNGQIANGNYWNDKATHLTTVRNCGSFGAQRNGSGPCEPVPQLALRNQTLINGNDSCTVASGPYVPRSHYATHQNPLTADLPQTVMANGTNPQMTRTTTENKYCNSQEVLRFSGVASGPPPTGTQGHGNFTAAQHLNRNTGLLQGASVNPSFNFYGSVDRNPSHRYLPQATAVAGQGVMSGGDGTVKKGIRKGMSSTGDAMAPPTGEITSTEEVLVDRGKDIRANPALFSSVGQHPGYLHGLLNRNRGPVVSSPCPRTGQSGSRNNTVQAQTSTTLHTSVINLLKSQAATANRTGTGSGTGSMVPERTNDIPPRSSAPTGAYCSNINLPYYSVNGNNSVSQHCAFRSGPGYSLSMQNVMEQQQPSSYFQSSSAASNFSTNSLCTEKPSCHFSPTGHQLPRAGNPVRGRVQEANHHAQSSNGKAPLFFPPETLNKGVAVTTRQVEPTQTVKPAPSQIPLSNVENQSGHPHALGSGYVCASTFPNQAKVPHRRLPDELPAGDPPPYPQTHTYFVTVTKNSPGTGFTAKNVIFMPDDHESALRERLNLSSKEKTVNFDSGATYGALVSSSDPKKCETQLSTAIPRAESVFNMPKPKNQQTCTGSSGQRAVAVVPPISQQSSNSADEGSNIINANDGLPFKIKNVWSLTEEEYVTQQKIDNAVSVSAPGDMGSDANLKPNVLTTSVPAVCIDSSPPSEWTASPLEKIAQALDLVSPSISNTAVSEMDIQTSNPPDLQPKPIGVAHQTEEISGLTSNVNDSKTQPSLDVSESGDQNGESKKNTFDLSSVPAYEWTIAKLNKLVSGLEWKQQSHQVEMDIDKLLSIYGSCSYPDLSNVFDSDLYMSIMNEVSSVSTQDQHAVIFSQIRRQSLNEVADNCHIIKHDATYSGKVYKSSWLNLNEQLDDIDKEHGFPLHLRFRHKEKVEGKELNESENGNLTEAPIEQETEKRPMPLVPTEVEMPASSDGVSHSKDPLSSIEVNALASEELNKSENGNLAESPIEQEMGTVPPVLTQTELPASEEGVRDYKDPLSSIVISVLSGEDARRFFNEQLANETKDLQSDVPKPDSEESGSQMEAGLPKRTLKEKDEGQMEVYCCLARWLCVMTGYGNKSVCSCQREAESNQEKRKPTASSNDGNVVPAASSLGGGPSRTVETAKLVHNIGTADLHGEKNVKSVSDKCTVTKHRSVGYPEQATLHRTKGRSVEPPSERKAETRMKAPSELSRVENQAGPETPPASVSCGSNVTEVEIQDVYSSYNEVLKIASAMSAPLWSRCSSKEMPHANLDGNDTSCGSTGAGNVSLGCNEVVAKCGTFSQQVRSPDAEGLQGRVHVHKHHASNDEHNHKVENIPKEGSKRKKRQWEISNPSSAGDLEKRNKKMKPQAVPEMKTTVVEYKSKSLQEKCKGDHLSESLRSKVPKGVKSDHPRDIPGNNRDKEKISRNGKVVRVLSKPQEKTSIVSLALYGSSPQKQNGTLRLHRRMNSKPTEVESSVGTIPPPPPKTVSFHFPSKKTNPFEHWPTVKSLAKQQVFARWKSSLVPAKDQSKPRNYKQNARMGTKSPHVTSTAHPNRPKSPTGQTSAPLLSQPMVTPIKLKAVTACLKKTKENKRVTPKSTENEFCSKPADQMTSKNSSAKRNAIEERLSKLKVMLVKRKPERVERRRATVPDTRTRSKCELGDPALIPLQQEDMLQFKLLPESFSFKDGQDCKETVKPKEVKKTESAKIDGQQSESMKMMTWKLQGSWSKSSKGKDLTPTEASSPSATTQSGTAFQEYKRKYMAKGKV